MKHILPITVAIAFAAVSLTAKADRIDLISGNEFMTGISSGANISNLFDNNSATNTSFTTGLKIYWTGSNAYTIDHYTITASDDNSLAPRKWVLEGSKDGSNWVNIDSRSAQSFGAGATRDFTIQANKQLAYNQFRLIVEQTKNGGSLCQIAEIHIFGEKAVIPTAPSDIRIKSANNGLIIAWRDNSDNETGFLIERSFNGKEWTEIARPQADETSYIDRGVPIGIGALYRICSTIGLIESPYATTGVIKTGEVSDITNINTNRDIVAYGTTPIHSGQDGPKGADGNHFTKYLSTQLPAVLTITIDKPIVVTQYSITAAEDVPSRDPRVWTVEASNDGKTWIKIDDKEGQIFGARYQTNRYIIENTNAFSQYRLTVTANAGAPLTQLADFCLYADIEPRQVASGLKAPTDLKINVRTYNQVELAWTDNNDQEDCYVIQRSTDGENWTRDYITRPNDQRCYPYALKPNTTYYFRIAAKSGDSTSDWSTVKTVTTPDDEWPEEWPNFNFDYGYHTGNLIKYYSNDDIAIFVNPADVNAEGVSIKDLDLSWMFEPYTEMWKAIRETYLDSYGEYLVSDPKLYIVPHYHADGGGLGRLYQYRDEVQLFRNIVHISVGKNSGWRWENNPGYASTNFLYDVLTHECGHIIEGIGSGKKNSPFYPVWLDSKWAEIFQYDIFGKMNPTHQAVWHKEYSTLGKATENSPAPGSEWYAKWLYPTYRDFGGDQLFLRFFALLGEYYFQHDGELQGDGNLGEYIHFMSGAAGVDVTEYAKDAFGWCDEWELMLLEARNRYPEIKYTPSPEQANLIRRSDAMITTTVEDMSTLANIKDGDLRSYFDTKTKNTDIEWIELTYSSSSLISSIEKMTLVAGGTAAKRPAAIILQGSNDGKNWVDIINDENPVVELENKFTYTVDEPVIYSNYKLSLKVSKSKYASLEIYEWEMYGQTFTAAPSRLAGIWDGTAVKLSWSAPYKDIKEFEIERADGNDQFDKIATIDVIELSYSDYDVETDKEYTYRVREIGTDGYVSPYCETVTVSTGNAGIADITSSDNIYSILDSNPDNIVYIYNVMGACVYSGTMTGSEMRSASDRFASGIYIAKIVTRHNEFKFKIISK